MLTLISFIRLSLPIVVFNGFPKESSEIDTGIPKIVSLPLNKLDVILSLS